MKSRNDAATDADDADDTDHNNVRSQTGTGNLTLRPRQTKELRKSRTPGDAIVNPSLVSLICLGFARSLWMSL